MNEMMKTGLEVMVVGMGAVFIFLTLLIGVVIVLTRTIQHYKPPLTVENSATVDEAIPHDVVAAIVGGIHAYRQNK
ncbi:MAG: OadG family transporter subunit [Methylococcales bacterium]